MPLFMTIIVGVFILIGSVIFLLSRRNDKIVDFSISMAFGVIISLVCIELAPEAYELLTDNIKYPLNILLILFFGVLGIIILKILDTFIPDHDLESDSEEDKKENLYHIGIMASIALILHNLIEGMTIYITASSSLDLGILITLGVGLHNIPMGLIVTSTLYDTTKDKKKTIILLIIIALSTFMGGIIMMLLSKFITDVLLGILLCITLGMLVYICLFELIPELRHSKNKKVSVMGMVLGVLVFLLSVIFE